MASLTSKPGISSASAGLYVPKDWDQSWFRRFLTDHLKLADARNATGTNGITISGNITQFATIGLAGPVTIPAPPSGDTLTVAPSFSSGALIATSAALASGAGASVGTLTNAPSAGNPTKWIKINDNGTIRSIPAW